MPPGFVVTAQGFEIFLKQAKLDKIIQKQLKKLDLKNTKALNQAADTIIKAVKEAPLSKKLEQAIGEAYDQLSDEVGDELLVAVRPSLVSSPLSNRLLTGPRVAFLNVKGKRSVNAAVHRLIGQLYEPSSLYYRALHGEDQTKVKLAVMVQVMIQPKISGVTWTTDPVLGDDKMVIEAVWGLGEALVDGLLSPDRYIVDKHSLRVLSHKITLQPWQLEYQNGRNRHVGVPKKWQDDAKLDSAALIELTRLGKQIEQKRRLPQAIEWVIDGDKQLWLVDLSPITGLRSTKWQIVPIQVADKSPTRVAAGEVGEVILKGVCASVGTATGKVELVDELASLDQFKPGSILVAELTSPVYIQAIQKAAAIITDTGGTTSHAAIIARELGIPSVVGTGNATHILREGQIVTVDGTQGVIYKGKVDDEKIKEDHKSVSSSKYLPAGKAGQVASIPVTATKIMVNISDPGETAKLAKLPVDGVGLLRGEFLIAKIGQHPLFAIKKGETKTYIRQLVDSIGEVALSFTPKPVIYRLSDLKTNQYRDLEGGAKLEVEELNPMLGFRGTRRFLDQPELAELELEAVKTLRDRHNLKNLQLMIPFVRTISELKQIKFLIEKSGLARGKDFKLWLMIEVPSNIFLIDKFIGVGIDGIAIGSNGLTQLILGVDRDASQLGEDYDERDEAVKIAGAQVINHCRQLGITTSVCGAPAGIYPEFLETVVRAGVTSVSVSPDSALDTRRLVASIEKRILLDHAIEL